MKLRHIVIFLLGIVAFARCVKEEKLFRLVPSSESGITFINKLNETPEFNILNYMYFYNGGGVATGDLNGDGLTDIYFTANQELNRLYLNTGNLKFKDITEVAGVAGFKGWSTGVTMADVNADGRLDIYVGYLGDYLGYKGRNQLFMNEGNDASGIPHFTDRAIEFGLDLVGFSTQAAFFDYDRDGDLDMFMLNHSLHQLGTFAKATLRKMSHPQSGDKLLRNDNGQFVDVSRSAGIYSSVLGYGLGVVVSDVNVDGWPDIYVGNDFHENDYLYINQGNGTFQELCEEEMMHTSRYTMGVDFADFNNDGFPDLIGMDMLPKKQEILKASAAEDNYEVFNFKVNFGYSQQFARNVLQLNNKDGTFSDIALLSGTEATDWSWSALFADFNLDGHKDILVSNGISRRPNDLDYLNFMQTDSIQIQINKQLGERELAYISKMPRIKIPNFLFVNNRDSTFTDMAREWGLETPSYSNGAAYADLDNDGDLDIVMNNVDDEAFLYENRTLHKKQLEPPYHFLQFSFKGSEGNTFGVGAKVYVYDSGYLQMQECMATRGFQSAVDYRMTFGTGSKSGVDSALVIWNDGSYQRLGPIKADQHLSLEQKSSMPDYNYTHVSSAPSIMQMATSEIGLPFKHEENDFVEFNREPLIPHMMSSEGPASAVVDINNDGRADVFLGGAKWKKGRIYIQTSHGRFLEQDQPALKLDSTFEDVDAAFFDADNDSDPDLFVVSGGNEFSGTSKYRQPRLYLNDGKGNFARSSGIPEVYLAGSCIAVNDLDGDGDLDVFLGARTTTWRYGISPDSFILINDGKGNFEDATLAIAPELLAFGFVKSATWTDIDNDQDDDLVIAAEWSPITVFLNDAGNLKLLQAKDSGLEKTNGWWNVIRAIDYDQDGDMDLIAGNLGLNSKLKSTFDEPVKMFVGDFDKNDSTDQILTHFVDGKEYPFHTRDEITKQLPYLKKRFLSYQKFAATDLHGIFDEALLKNAIQYSAYTFETSVIENLGNLRFRMKPLPKAAQFSTVNAILAEDFDHDGNTDIILAGNFYPVNIQMGRYDASFGVYLKGNGHGGFRALTPVESGISIKHQTRAFRKIKIGETDYFLAIRNNNKVDAFREYEGTSGSYGPLPKQDNGISGVAEAAIAN